MFALQKGFFFPSKATSTAHDLSKIPLSILQVISKNTHQHISAGLVSALKEGAKKLKNS